MRRQEKEKQSRFEEELKSLRDRIKALESCERELRPWKEREPKIMYYLGVFQEVMQ